MANKSNDYSKMFQEMMSQFPVDAKSYQDTFKNYAGFGERFSKVVIEAAEKSTDISAKWAKETLEKMSAATAVRDDPSEYGKAMSEFASAQAETTAETMAAFAEVAKRVQMETVELMLAAGKDMSEDMSAAAKKAADKGASSAKSASK